MVHALKIKDSGGLAHTVFETLHLRADILNSKVTGGPHNCLMVTTFGLTSLAAISYQTDWSEAGLSNHSLGANVDAFISAKENWMEILLKERLTRSRHVDLR